MEESHEDEKAKLNQKLNDKEKQNQDLEVKIRELDEQVRSQTEVIA